MKQVRIGYLSTAYHTSFILMGANWIRRRMNAQAEWRLFPTGPEMIKAFTRSELDIGYIGLPPVMIGISKGLPIRCVAGGHMEGTVFTASRNLKTFEELGSIEKTLNQFKGRTVGTPTRGSIHDVIIRNLLEKLQRLVHLEGRRVEVLSCVFPKIRISRNSCLTFEQEHSTYLPSSSFL